MAWKLWGLDNESIYNRNTPRLPHNHVNGTATFFFIISSLTSFLEHIDFERNVRQQQNIPLASEIHSPTYDFQAQYLDVIQMSPLISG